jgi:hypothetical protein
MTSLPTTTWLDSNLTVGLFEGCGTFRTGWYRPAHSCRMSLSEDEWTEFCPVCRTHLKKMLHPFQDHDFGNVLSGDFNGDGLSDVLIHNGRDLQIHVARHPMSYRGQGLPPLRYLWTGNNVVPAAPGGRTWETRPNDQYQVADFDGDGIDDVIAFNERDWQWPRLGLLRATGNALGLQCVARYGELVGSWRLVPGDKLSIGDFDGDGKKDVVLINGDNPLFTRYVGVFRSTGTALSEVIKYTGNLPPSIFGVPGWTLRVGDRAHVGDFNADGKDDLYLVNTADPATPTLAMFRSHGSGFGVVKFFQGGLAVKSGDQFHVGDFNGDGKDDLYVLNGTAFPYTSLMMVESTGTDLRLVKLYYTGGNTTVPGWGLSSGDRLFVSNVNTDNKADLVVFNTSNWGTEFLAALVSDGTSLRASPWSADTVRDADPVNNPMRGWDLAADNKILVANYAAGPGTPNLFIRNDEWFGQLQYRSDGFVLDRVYYRWLSSPLYDSKPWSDRMP